MTIHVLTGADSRAIRAARSRLCSDASQVETFAVADDHGQALAVAATTPSLFFPTRTLVGEPADLLSVTAAAQIASHRAPGVTLVLCSSAAVPAGVRAALGDAHCQTFPLPTAKDAHARVRALLDEFGLTATPAAAQTLTALAPSQWDRVCHATQELAGLGATRLDLPELTAYLGTAQARAVPWALTDALTAGDLATALTVCPRLEPIPTVAYLAKLTAELGTAVDTGSLSGRAGGLGRRLGPGGVRRTWDLVAAADRDVKVAADPAAVLAVLVVRLADIWKPSTL